MAFQQGLSGLSIASKALDAISNNVSNSGTVGFKQAGAQFADVFAASLAAGSSTQVGIGATIGNVAQQFTQGNISTTSNTLDLAINGSGFYRMSDNGSITYSRNGQFHVDKNGYVVNSSGLRLTGNTFDAKGLPSGVGGDIQLSFGDADPKATTSAGYNVNLDSRSASPKALTKATLYGTGVPGTVATPLVLNSTNNTLSIAVDGEAAASVNIAAGSYPDSSSLVAAIQAGIDKSSLKGRVEVSADSSGKLTLTSQHGGRLSSLLVGGTAASSLLLPSGVTVSGSNAVVATLSGSVAAPVTITPSPAAGTTSTLSIAVDGGAPVTVTINAATYPDAASLVTAMQAAGFEARHAIVDAAHRREEEHRRRHAGGARGLHEREPVHRRQHAVDDQHVVLLAGREVEPVAAVIGMVDHMTVLAQALGDVVGGLFVVFYEEDFHDARLTGAVTRRNAPQLYKHSIWRPSGRYRPKLIFRVPPRRRF